MIMKKTPLEKANKAYSAQKTRCYNSNATQFKYYGGKGIKILYSKDDFIVWWLDHYKNFKGTEAQVGRIDHSKDYSFDNIEMVDKSVNCKERIRRNGTPIPMRPVVAINKLTGEKTKHISSCHASWATGHSQSTVLRQCNNAYKNKKTRFVFEFLDE